jgi:Peptidase A4 family
MRTTATPHTPRLLGASLLPALIGLLALAPASAGAARVSSNWAGYVASPATHRGTHFRTVSGTWIAPAATCSAGHATYSAAWVGLGGDSSSASALEQIGTDSDCTRAGHARYSSWYELLPAGAVNLPLKISAGDEISASATVAGHTVTLKMRDVTTGAHVTRKRRASSIDTSSAEWIIEAPSACAEERNGSCEVLALTNFGTFAFSSATATIKGHTGTIADSRWAAEALELRQGTVSTSRIRAGALALPSATEILATPSSVLAANGSFTVTWQQHTREVERPSAPTLPASSGGAP